MYLSLSLSPYIYIYTHNARIELIGSIPHAAASVERNSAAKQSCLQTNSRLKDLREPLGNHRDISVSRTVYYVQTACYSLIETFC